MLMSVHSLLRRHCRPARWTLAVLTVGAVALTTHTTVMGDGPMMGEHAVGHAAALCIALGGSVAVAGVAVFAARHPAQRPTWRIVAEAAPDSVIVGVACPFPVRAGPPDLQVLRL
jgi:hypothetical protein